MDFSESTKIVYDRIQKLEPEKVSKIIGFLLLQDHGEEEMIRLAYGPDNLIHSLINKAKTHLNLPSNSTSPTSISNSMTDLPLKFPPFPPNPQSLTIFPPSYPEDYHFQNQLHFLQLDNHIDPSNSPNYYSTPTLCPRISQTQSQRSPNLHDFPIKICHYFMEGCCRHGNNCRYSHCIPTTEHFSIFTPEDDNVFSPGSLKKLEIELTELLKSRKGYPVSIAALPLLYYEKFGKTLQAEGYLTESQRHGKAGFSLTKLLARLKRITLIDRPHGQHAVILADEIAKYTDYGDRNEQGGIVAGSKQIYLTFPAESTFTEQDVSNYFKKFGPVHDVRIPCQQKRMFGFVTFVYTETVKEILNKGNPHFVCGARVLVKPYREKSRDDNRKIGEKFRHNMYYGPHGFESESELQSMSRICDGSLSLKNHMFLEEQQEHGLELERLRFSEMQLGGGPTNRLTCFGYSLEELQLSEGRRGQMNLSSMERFGHLLDVFKNRTVGDERIRQINTKYNDQENTQGLNLPDSPFASPLKNGISTAT